jgi:hypothetical protein
MTTTTRSFPVERGLQGINRLAILLNNLEWHFAMGTRFSNPIIDIYFDDPSDADLAWRNVRDSRLAGPAAN